MERARFGASDAATVAHIHDELRNELDAAADRLGAIASRIRTTPDMLRVAPRDPAVARVLFDQVSTALDDQEEGRTGVTVYGADATPIAWAGRVFDLPRARLDGPSALFVSQGAIGPRLIRTQTLGDRISAPRGTPAASGVIVVEQSLARVENGVGTPDTFVLSTSLVPVRLRARVGAAPPRADPFVFVVSSRSGSLLVEAEVSRADLANARAQWRRNTWAAAIAVLGLTLLLCTGPIVESRRRATDVQGFLAHTLALATTVVAALALLLFSVRNVAGSAAPTSPMGLFLIALASLALVAIAVDLVERRRSMRTRVAAIRGSTPSVAVRHAVAAVMAAALLTTYEVALRRVVTNSTLDVLHFSLHPLATSRLAVAFALVLLHAAAMWAAVVVTRAAVPSLHLPRRLKRWAIGGWIAGAALAIFVASQW